MPLHTLGIRSIGWYGVTWGDVTSVLLAVLFFWQPLVDHAAVMQWVIDHCFGGSIAACSIFGTFVSHKLLEWGGMGFYAALYKYEQYQSAPGAKAIAAAKIDPSEPWMWSNPDPKVGEKHAALESRSLWFIVKYHTVVSIVQFLIFTTAIQWNWEKGGIQWEWIAGHPELSRADPALIPSKATVAWQCLVSTFAAETGFYFAHRLMHENAWLYRFHKRHHEYRDSTVYATFYVGLVDSILTDFIPAGFGIVFYTMHQWTVWMFTLPLILNALRVHCGYDNERLARVVGLPLNPSVTLPLCTDAERTHDMHHRFNTGNYGGAYFLWDRLLGTWTNPDEEIAMKKAGKTYNPYRILQAAGRPNSVAPMPVDANKTE